MKVVIVTYNWPPRNAIGSHRPYSWAKYFASCGDEVTILTAKKYAFDAPLDLALPPVPGIRVLEVAYIGQSKLLGRLLDRIRKIRLLRALWRRVGTRSLLPVDVRSLWASAARDLARELASQADVVISSFGPDSSHLIACQMKQANGSLAWIADYRDLWSINHAHPSASPSLLKREREVIATADLLTTVSAELASSLVALHDKRTEVISNGYDEQEDEVRRRFISQPRGFGKIIRIVYTGTIYPHRQDPAPLLLAIRNLIVTGRIRPGEVTVDFYGSRLQALNDHLRTEYRPFVRLMGHVTRDRAIQIQRDADLLLLLEQPGEKNHGVVTGKIFEYIAAGRPILSVGSDVRSAIGRILNDTGCGICLEQDVSALELLILQVLCTKKAPWFSPNLNSVLSYARGRQATRLRYLAVQIQRQKSTMSA